MKPPNGRFNGLDGILPGVFALPVLVQVVAQHVAQRGCHYRPFLGAQLLDVLAALHGKADIARHKPRIRQCVPGVDVQAGIVAQHHLGDSGANTGLQDKGLAPRPHVHAKARRYVRACVIDNVLLGDSHFLNAYHLAVFDDGTDCGREFGKVVLGEDETHTPLGQLLWRCDFIYILATQNRRFNAFLDGSDWFAKVLGKQ